MVGAIFKQYAHENNALLGSVYILATKEALNKN